MADLQPANRFRVHDLYEELPAGLRCPRTIPTMGANCGDLDRMRGVVSAGMVTALEVLGLRGVSDAVYS